MADSDGIVTQGILIDVTVFPAKFNDPTHHQTFATDLADFLEVDVEGVTAQNFGECRTVFALGRGSSVMVTTWPEHNYVQIDISSRKDFDPEALVGFIRDEYKLDRGHYSNTFRGVTPPIPDLVQFIEDVA